MVKDATLDCYKALEVEHKKWVACEGRLVEQLETAKRDHQIRSGEAGNALILESQLKETKKQQNSLIVQLSEAKMKNGQMDDAQKAQDQRIDELNTEILLLKTKLCGIELPSGSPPVTLSRTLSVSFCAPRPD